MADTRASPNWKQALRLSLRIYAAICTVLVTSCLALALWSVLFQKPAPVGRSAQEVFESAYFSYMLTEYPERGNAFNGMAEALCDYVEKTPIAQIDLFRYLGKPDEFCVTNVPVRDPSGASVTNRIALFAYLYRRPGLTNNWSATALVQNGKVEQVTIRETNQTERKHFQPFRLDSAPNQQRAADGSQRFRSDTNIASFSAGSRR